jgi:hypothetical protein
VVEKGRAILMGWSAGFNSYWGIRGHSTPRERGVAAE